jgi:hypothetical protein
VAFSFMLLAIEVSLVKYLHPPIVRMSYLIQRQQMSKALFKKSERGTLYAAFWTGKDMAEVKTLSGSKNCFTRCSRLRLLPKA